jgi:hypothetical protein
MMELSRRSENMVTFRTIDITPNGESVDMEWDVMTLEEIKAIYNLITTKDE